MSAPMPPRARNQPPSGSRDMGTQRPTANVLQTTAEEPSESSATIRPSEGTSGDPQRKKRNHRGGKKKRRRRQSFAASTEDGSDMPHTPQLSRPGASLSAARSSFYRMQTQNLSGTSIESEALLDHRYIPIINDLSYANLRQRAAKYAPS